jgi:hypothetical protein
MHVSKDSMWRWIWKFLQNFLKLNNPLDAFKISWLLFTCTYKNTTHYSTIRSSILFHSRTWWSHCWHEWSNFFSRKNAQGLKAESDTHTRRLMMQIKRQAACRNGRNGARCVELSWLDVFTSPLLSPHCGVSSTCTRTQGNLLAVFFYGLVQMPESVSRFEHYCYYVLVGTFSTFVFSVKNCLKID